MVHRLVTNDIQATILNFGSEYVSETINSESFVPHAKIIDMSNNSILAQVDDLDSFQLALASY
ncbi:hypothetical protein M1512_03205 [Patescibacteria group bacterium]|nr:hypothetical protein [Patescibacteria group bacterium]